MQAFNVSFLGFQNNFYVQVIQRYLRNNPGRAVTQFQVSSLLYEAYMKAATPLNAIFGFKKCDIESHREHIFTEVNLLQQMLRKYHFYQLRRRHQLRRHHQQRWRYQLRRRHLIQTI